jgi:hypothetical protein
MADPLRQGSGPPLGARGAILTPKMNGASRVPSRAAWFAANARSAKDSEFKLKVM